MPLTKYPRSGKVARKLSLPITLIRKDGKEYAIVKTTRGKAITLDKDEAQMLQDLGWLGSIHLNHGYPFIRIIQKRKDGQFKLVKCSFGRALVAIRMVLEARANGLAYCAGKGFTASYLDGNPLNQTKANSKVVWHKDNPNGRPRRNGYWDVAEAWRLRRLLDAGLDPREETERAYREQLAAKRVKKEGEDGK